MSGVIAATCVYMYVCMLACHVHELVVGHCMQLATAVVQIACTWLCTLGHILHAKVKDYKHEQ